MLKTVKKKLKSQKGFTLIELLAVIVILGILAAIAIPSVLGIIDNSRKDAHIANAQQAAQSARLYVGDKKINVPNSKDSYAEISLTDLIGSGYMEKIQDPSNGTNDYDSANSNVRISRVSDGSNEFLYKVTLKSQAVGDSDTVTTYVNGSVDASKLQRTNVTLP